MPTFSAITLLQSKAQAEQLSDMLEEFDPAPTGVGIFMLEDGSGLWEVGAYFMEKPDETRLALAAAATEAKPFVVSEIPETDWVAKVRRELSPVEAGRFFVYGSHDADKVPDDGIALLIEAAMAFGTGHHGTTLGCLRAVDRLMDEGFVGQSVADIGAGTAVLAMAAAKVWPNKVIASDIDEVAVEVAEANAKANGVADQLICIEAAGFDHPVLAEKAPFDLVFANILMGPLLHLAADMSGAMSKGGYAILSGILVEQAADVIKGYAAVGLDLYHHEEIGEWATLTLVKT